MKFNPGRENLPFQYKGYEAWIRRADNPELTKDAIEIRLVLRSETYQTMTLSFLISETKLLYKVLRAAIRTFDKAERRLK